MGGKNCQRVGDSDSGGGKIVEGVNSVRVNGKPIAVTGKSVASHSDFKSPHTSAKTLHTQSKVKAGNKPVVRTGDKDTCGHGRVGGSPDVFVGG